MLRSMFSSAIGQVVLGTPCDNIEIDVPALAPATAMEIFRRRYLRARRCTSLVFGRSSCIAEGAAHWP